MNTYQTTSRAGACRRAIVLPTEYTEKNLSDTFSSVYSVYSVVPPAFVPLFASFRVFRGQNAFPPDAFFRVFCVFHGQFLDEASFAAN
jgi:hypothetical protein